MANIKGIIVEIGGDTSGLQKALSKVNSSTASLSKELKGVNSLLKLDPKNTELVSQKQQILKESIEQTSKKLEELKKAQEMADDTIANGGKISQENYRNLQREIINTQNKLNNLKVEASKWTTAGRSIEEFGNKITNISNKIDKMGTTLTTRLTLPIVGITTTAIASMDAVDEGLDTIATKTGATGSAAKELQQIYKEVASEVPGDFGDIGAAIGEINTRLDLTGDKLKTASIDFLKFAKVNGVDVNTSVQLVTRAMGDAGIEADKYSELLDMLTVAGQKSGISIESLTTNLAKYGAPMRALGIDTKNAIAMFAGWEKAGVNTEIAFSGMKKAISNWGAAGKDSTKEFSKTLNEIAKCPTIAKATTKAIEVFGAKAGPDLADAIKGGRFEFEKYIEALDNGTGTIENTYGQIVDEVDDAQLAMQNAKIAMHDAGEVAAKSLGPILLDLSKQFKGLMERFDKLSDKEKKQILNMGLMVASIGPAIKITSTLGKTVGTVTKGVGTFLQAIAVAKNNSIATSESVNKLAIVVKGLTTPMGLATAAITTLCAAYAAWYIADTAQKASLGGLRDEVKKQKESWESLAESRQTILSSTIPEIETYGKLSDELKQITDENGKVKQGYEDRAQTILGILSKALGTEYTMTGDVIDKYQDLQNEIDKTIAVKKAEAVLNAYQQEYVTAMTESSKATETLVGLKQKLAEAAEKMASGNAKERKEAEIQYSSIAKQIGEQTEIISKYGKTINDVNNLQKVSAEGSAEAIDKAITQIGVSYETLKQKSEQSIEQQIINQGEYIKLLKESWQDAVDSNDTYQSEILNKQLSTQQQELASLADTLAKQTSSVTELSQEQINAWKILAEQSYSEYSTALSKVGPTAAQKIQEATGIISTDTTLTEAAGKQGNQATILFGNNLKLANEAENEISNSASALEKDTTVQDEAGNLADRAQSEIEKNDSKTWGEDMVEGLGNGIKQKSEGSWFTGILSGLAGTIASFIHFSRPDRGPLREYEKWMPDMIQGLAKTLDSSSPKLLNSASNLSKKLEAELNNMNMPKVQDFGKLQGSLSREINSNTKNINNDNRKITFNIQGSNAKEIVDEINKIFGRQYT